MKAEKTPLEPKAVVQVPLRDVHRDNRAWHTRVYVREQDVDSLSRAISATGQVVPIHVVRSPAGGYDYVTGLYRLLAVERLGHDTIPAFVEEELGEELLLRTALLDQEVRFPLSYMERGWSFARLQQLRADADLPSRPTDLSREFGLDVGTVSTCLGIARALPIGRARHLERQYGMAQGTITTLARAPLRLIARADSPEEEDRLLAAACSALVRGECATRAVQETKREHSPDPDGSKKARDLTGWMRRLFQSGLCTVTCWFRSILNRLQKILPAR